MMTDHSVYVAADYARKTEVAELCGHLAALGLRPTSTWALDGEPGEGLGGELEGDALATAQAAATLGLGDIDRSELFVVLTTGEKARGGRHAETGYAIAKELTVIVVGPLEHVFHYTEGVHHVESQTELLLWLRGWLAA